MAYSGWRLNEEAKSVLMERFTPRFPDVIAHHITFMMGSQVCPQEVSARVIGYSINEKGVEALVVEIDDDVARPDGKIYHITWSIDRSANFRPVDSNHAVAKGYTEIDPIDIKVTPFYVDNKGEEWLANVMADEDQ